MSAQQIGASLLPRILLQVLMLAFLLSAGQMWFYHDNVTTLGSARAWFLLTNMGAFVLFLPGLALFLWVLWSRRESALPCAGRPSGRMLCAVGRRRRSAAVLAPAADRRGEPWPPPRSVRGIERA